MTRCEIERLLRQRVGLDISTIGQACMDRALAGRMKITGCDNQDEYLKLLAKDSGEFEKIVTDLSIPETWFFRDSASFENFRTFIETRWKTSGKSKPLRILSIPCSTGEEAYSIAITLFEAGLDKKNFHIDGVDINPEVLTLAKKGVFRPKSFRDKFLALRTKYFTQNIDTQTFELSPEIISAVHFSKGNILSLSFLAEREPYDVIFCRNLLIYMDPESKTRVWDTIDKLLVDDGIVFTGPAETVQHQNYEKAFPSYSFAFKRSEKQNQVQKTAVKSVSNLKNSFRIVKPAKPAPSEKSFPALNSPAENTPQTQMRIDDKKTISLESVLELANEGKHDTAIDACKKILQTEAPSAEAYFVLGLILQEAGAQIEAEANFHKALYLDSNHERSLMNLALLAEIRGDTALAENFRSRLHRVRKRNLEFKLQS